MGNSITELSNGRGNIPYYDPGLRRVLEDHLSLLRDSENAKVHYITTDVAHKYRGAFYDLLQQELRIDPHLHWLILRASGYTSSEDVGMELATIVIPNESEVMQLVSLYGAGHRVIGVS